MTTPIIQIVALFVQEHLRLWQEEEILKLESNCIVAVKLRVEIAIVEIREGLTPKGPSCIFCQHSDFGQLTTNGVFIFFL